MRYYLDTEFNGFGGDLISLALLREDGGGIYLVLPFEEANLDPWVRENVIPILYDVPPSSARAVWRCQDVGDASKIVEAFLGDDAEPVIVTDWPDDVKYFCQLVITAPGQMINIAGFKAEVVRIDAYPNNIPGAVQHNAMWDAYALRHAISSLPDRTGTP